MKPRVRCASCWGLGLVFPWSVSAGREGNFQGFLSLSCWKVTLENLRQDKLQKLFLALRSLARVAALQRDWLRAGAETHAAQTDAAEKAGERRRGKKIRDNVFNLIRSLESLKCILPWALKFLSWNNQSNRLFAEDSGSTHYDAGEISDLLKYCPLVLRDGSSLFGNRLSLPASYQRC